MGLPAVTSNRLRLERFVRRRFHRIPNPRQFDERWQVRPCAPGDGNIDSSGIHISEAEQRQHGLAVQVRALTSAQERLSTSTLSSTDTGSASPPKPAPAMTTVSTRSPMVSGQR
jgi:hypothetical protein